MILYCYTQHHAESVDALPLDAIRVELDPSDVTAYAKQLCEAWLWEGDLIVVEHDIVIHPSVLTEFEDCDQPWCVFPYAGPPMLDGTPVELAELGCVRFTRRLKNALPSVMVEAASTEGEAPGLNAGDWRRMDIRLRSRLEAFGHARHYHYPAVRHLHEY